MGALDCQKILSRQNWDVKKKQVVLIACGSFSPITYLHLRLFEMARDALHDTGEYQVVGGFLSPVSDDYKKSGLAAAQHRVNMCRLAVQDSDWIDVDEWESEQPVYHRTIQVLNSIDTRIKVSCADVQVKFLAGADLIKSFEIEGLWSHIDRMEILGKYGLVVIDRWDSDISEFLLTDPILYTHRKNIHVVKQFISNDISSTKIRLYISRSLSVKYLTPDAVIQYISQNGLFNE